MFAGEAACAKGVGGVDGEKGVACVVDYVQEFAFEDFGAGKFA